MALSGTMKVCPQRGSFQVNSSSEIGTYLPPFAGKQKAIIIAYNVWGIPGTTLTNKLEEGFPMPGDGVLLEH